MSKSQYADQPKPDHHAPHGSHFEVPQDHEIDFELRFRPSGIDKPLAATLDAEPVPDQQTSRALHLIPLSILSWRVKAGESGTLEQRWVSPIDIDVPLVSIRAGRRIRGASISVDGKRVFDIPDWDPHWQQTWEIPNLRMSKGMQVVATFKVDNSEENPRNPEPPRDMQFGRRTGALGIWLHAAAIDPVDQGTLQQIHRSIFEAQQSEPVQTPRQIEQSPKTSP